MACPKLGATDKTIQCKNGKYALATKMIWYPVRSSVWMPLLVLLETIIEIWQTPLLLRDPGIILV